MGRLSFIGKKYGKLLIINDELDKNKTRYVNCLCDCGNYKVIGLEKVKSGHTQSCGCLKGCFKSKKGMVVGNVYNRFTVLEELQTGNDRRMVRCLCECGKEKNVSLYKLKSGHTKSCGCYSKEIVSKRITQFNLSRPRKIKTQEEIDAQKLKYRIQKREYTRVNKERIKQYKKDNWARILEYKKEVQKNSMNDPKFVLLKRLRGRIYAALKRGNKSDSTKNLLGCSLDFFKQHIEGQFAEGMSWENMGIWHLDHIKPCCLFDLTKEEEQRKCFNYTNMQPLWRLDNLKKGTNYE